jgi:hypothetical protein
MQAPEGLGERFDREVFGIVYIANHFQDHMIDGPFVPLQQFRISAIIPRYRPVNQAEILHRLIREITF